MDTLLEKNESLHGVYRVFSESSEASQQFIKELTNYLGYDVLVDAFIMDSQQMILVLIVISLGLLFLFYFIFCIYEYYKQSHNIGVMKLLGFDTKKINWIFQKRKYIIYIISSFLLLLLFAISIKNMTLNYLIKLCGINILILILTIFLQLLICKIIERTYKISNILKNQNLALKICKISYRLKIVMTVVLVLFLYFSCMKLNSLSESLKNYKASKGLLNYGVIARFIADQPELRQLEKQRNFYLKIINDKNLETFYAKFPSKEMIDEIENLNQNDVFLYGSVDQNYLRKEKFKIFHLDGTVASIEELNQLSFLFPKSKESIMENFRIFYEKENEYSSQYTNQKFQFHAYFYDDRPVNTYRIELNSKVVESPILRVIDETITTPYFLDPLGVSVFGNLMNTGLKIKVEKNKEETWKILEKYIQETGLENLIERENFISYSDYFNDEIQLSKKILILSGTIFVIISLIYSFISSQILMLYILGNRKQVYVKKILGFESIDILNPILKKNISGMILAVLISIILLFFIKNMSIGCFIFSILLFFLLDSIIMLIVLRGKVNSKIAEELKGGKV